ncbi:ComF family protein [Luteimonas colneyensis]|jgi:ComF family protein|uniref:ComF family protein n=1 Tax=Luteimonas colneyensis TaxID=2762230 RepID=UPI001CD81F71|nr:ComF family protein [Luteimonas colneyensis]
MPGPVNLAQAAPVDGWLARIGRGLWAPRCLVCAEGAAGPLDLCTRCAAALPWMPPACLCCAMPLPAPASASALSRPVGAATAATGATRGCPAIPVAAVAAPTGGWVAAGRLCSACQRHPPALAQAHAAFLYGFPLDRLLPRLKFHRDLAAGRLLAQAMAATFAACEQPDALVPVPLHRARLRQRGYNQALELARPLGRMLGLPVQPGLLLRIRNTAAQSRLDAGARSANLRDAFDVPTRVGIPAHLVLVDDVMTTGATLDAAAEALLEAGADRVDAWVCARAP